MTHSPLTNRIKISTQSSSRQGAAIDTFLIHHAATVSVTGESIVNMMVNKTRVVSSNYVIGSDGTVWLVVDEDLRAWTSGSTTDGGRGAAWDRRSITVEIANSSSSPEWEISSAAISSAAKLLNDIRSRYTINNVLGHNDLWTKYGASYPTYCPGPNTVSSIISEASNHTSASKDTEMRIIYNTDSNDDSTRRALIGELSFQVITAAQSVREGKLWGPTVNFTVGEWNAARDLVIARRTELGLPVAISEDGSVCDLSDLPTKGELGQALTSTVALVKEHSNTNRDTIIDAIGNIPGANGQASTYSLNLNIDNIPGTATGTATPA